MQLANPAGASNMKSLQVTQQHSLDLYSTYRWGNPATRAHHPVNFISEPGGARGLQNESPWIPEFILQVPNLLAPGTCQDAASLGVSSELRRRSGFYGD